MISRARCCSARGMVEPRESGRHVWAFTCGYACELLMRAGQNCKARLLPELSVWPAALSEATARVADRFR